ncbi:hypothetical protein [Streptomyces ipomoeae]|uniref:hypothetical protein n=1 Tax=Streptomyces ipomoeae TaxID=103232 RepID=UPI00114644D7|nr:hypothetical protein [Streptomyces ipomoeae]MDX2937303.1 hypothetical protein [Streptomyces ipomoeae]TQE27230.1 hypothetical protein SipoB123_12435 [Streptomyces ipomoeae]
MALWDRTPERRRATAWPSSSCAAVTAADEHEGLRPETLYRGVSGVDRGPVPMGAEQTAGLRDPMATVFFRRGRWPMTLEEVLDGLTQAGELPAQSVYLIGEAGQIAPDEAPGLRRDFRFAVSRAAPGKDPDLLVSSDPGSVFLQVAAWDPVALVFNYYMRISPAWVWTGDSWSALAPESRGKGCFDSHVNGSVVMKELKQPWSNWQSMSATIQLAPDDPLRGNPLHRQVIGAERLELTVKGLVSRWTTARLSAVVDDGMVRHPDHLLRQLFTSTTVNLASTSTQSAAVAPGGKDLVLPLGFWLNADALIDDLGLPVRTQTAPAVPASLYVDSLAVFGFRLQERASGFSRPDDTFFAFVVPEAAFEDNEVVRQLVQKGLVPARFAACALMVDFTDPVFSPARAHLMRYVPTAPVPVPTWCDDIAAAIVAAAPALPADSPEGEFARNWALPEADWRGVFAERVDAYLEKVAARIRTTSGFHDCTRLAESRRRAFKEMRLNEFALTLPTTDIPADAPPLRMNEDGTVSAVTTGGSP